MSISNISGGQNGIQEYLISNLQSKGLSSDKASFAEQEIHSAAESLRQSGQKPDPSSLKAAVQEKLAKDVQSGSLTQDEADQVLKALDELDQKLAAAGPPKGGPEATELFKKLDEDGDGSVSREEFVNGRPDDVSQDQAASLFDKMANGADSLTEDQFTQGMEANKPEKQADSGQSPLQSLLSSLQGSTSLSDAEKQKLTGYVQTMLSGGVLKVTA